VVEKELPEILSTLQDGRKGAFTLSDTTFTNLSGTEAFKDAKLTAISNRAFVDATYIQHSFWNSSQICHPNHASSIGCSHKCYTFVEEQLSEMLH